MSNVNVDDINKAVAISKLQGFTGKYRALGGGEINDTFLLDCGNTKSILRISRYPDVKTLHQEARALSLLKLDQVPKLIYFDESRRIKDRYWIMESYLEGVPAKDLSIKQFESLGRLLAQIHKVQSQKTSNVNYWANFLDACKHFGNEETLLNHPDAILKRLINMSQKYFQSKSGSVTPVLIHGDATLSNMLLNGNEVSLIDWEFSKFKDPMADFSTIYYEDVEYNRGKWRIHIKDKEKDALLDGYTQSGGVVDERRLLVWMNLDKLGAAVYLYWKINQSGHNTEAKQSAQYRVDYKNLLKSLENNLPTSNF